MTNRKHFSSMKKALLCMLTGTLFNFIQNEELSAIRPRQSVNNSSDRVIIKTSKKRPSEEIDNQVFAHRPTVQSVEIPSASAPQHTARPSTRASNQQPRFAPHDRPIAQAATAARPSHYVSPTRPTVQPVALPSANEPHHTARPATRASNQQPRFSPHDRPIAQVPTAAKQSPYVSPTRPTVQPVNLPSANEPQHTARPTRRDFDENLTKRPRPSYPRPNHSSPRPGYSSARPTQNALPSTDNQPSVEINQAPTDSTPSSSTASNATSSNVRPNLSYHRPTSYFNRPSWFPSSSHHSNLASSNVSTDPALEPTPEPTPEPAPEPQNIWALWNHANGDNSLADFIDFNALNMAKANINDSLLVLIQADRPHDYGTYRYQIKKGDIDLVDHLSYEMGQQPGKEIVDGISWLQDNYSFTHLILNLWGHGSGIEDPELRRLRGILFDDTNDTYLNNQDLSNAVDRIASKLGKKIDILGTDACLMGAIEIGWQVKNSVDILVASEDNEPGEGWNYAPFLNKIAGTRNISAKDSASAIVSAYGNYYSRTNRTYTLSAVELKRLPAVSNELRNIISKIKTCMKKDARAVLVAIMSARALTLQMDDNSYVDLSDFLSRLVEQLSRVKIRSFSEDSATEILIHSELNVNLDIVIDDSRNPISDVVAYFTDSEETKSFKTDIDNLKTDIANGISAIEKSVIANRAGNSMERAKGMTIYFPPIHSPIHPSYPLTKFAKETDWMKEFLINIMGYQII
ncbi:hypothetical protein JKY79_01420 [Candidatus Babeliales bacterium]|nr:hypothetical protein [Candidatus Babeliales bacterium]